MKVLHLVSYAVLSGPLPGVLLLARAQRQAGHSAYVVHDGWRGNFSPYEEMACGHPDVAELAAPWPLTMSPKGGIQRALRDVLLLRKLTTQGVIDVIHCHQSHDHLLAACAARGTTAVVRTVHAARAASRRPLSGWLWRRTQGAIARAQATAQALDAHLPSSCAPCHFIPGAIDSAAWQQPSPSETTAIARRALRARFGLPQAGALLGHIALMAERGQEELLEAFRQLWHACLEAGSTPLPHLVFVGRGPREVFLHWAVGRGPIAAHVHFTGYIEAAALPEFYGTLDGAFVAQPGNDGAARAALEAMAAGVPVIGVASPALQSLLQPEQAFIAQSRTVEAILSALQAWHENDHRRRRMGALSAQWVRQHRQPQDEAQATMAVYHGALARRRRTPTSPQG